MYIFMVLEPEVHNQGEICLFFLIYLLVQSFTYISVDRLMDVYLLFRLLDFHLHLLGLMGHITCPALYQWQVKRSQRILTDHDSPLGLHACPSPTSPPKRDKLKKKHERFAV